MRILERVERARVDDVGGCGDEAVARQVHHSIADIDGIQERHS
jgi:hypothetical protein